MTEHLSTARSVTVQLPEEAFQHRPWDPAELAQELLQLWLLEEVRARRLGFGKAAELAELSQARFLQRMAQHGITPFDYDDGELERELRPLP